jgi:hypothetical protein
MERMERKKRSGNVAKSNGNPLGALDAFIKEQAEANKPMQPDEFTTYDYINKMRGQGVKITYTTSVRDMKNLIEAGVVATRKAIKNGKQCNLYRFR